IMGMSEKLNGQQKNINDIIQDKYRIRRKLEATEMTYKEKVKQLAELRENLIKKEAALEKLEKMSISSLFYSILGTKQKRINEEKQEYLQAKLNYDECQ